MSVWVLVFYLKWGQSGGPFTIETKSLGECVSVANRIKRSKAFSSYPGNYLCVEVKK